MTTSHDEEKYDPYAPFLARDGWFYADAQGRLGGKKADHWGNRLLEKFDRVVAAREREEDFDLAEKARDARRRWLEACKDRVLLDLKHEHGFKTSDGQVVSHKKFDQQKICSEIFDRCLGISVAAPRERNRAGSFTHRTAGAGRNP